MVRLQVESYLDDNEEFAESYVMRKIKRSTIEKWLTQHSSGARGQGDQGQKAGVDKSRSISLVTPSLPPQQPASRRGSCIGSTRRMSASTFEFGGLQSPILSTGVDGSVSFVTLQPGQYKSRRE